MCLTRNPHFLLKRKIAHGITAINADKYVKKVSLKNE